MTDHPSSPRKKNYSAFAWALLSQSIWLPALIIDTQDRYASKGNDFTFTTDLPQQDISQRISRALATEEAITSGTLTARALGSKRSSGLVLNAILPATKKTRTEISDATSKFNITSPIAFSAPVRPLEVALQYRPNLIRKSYESNTPLLSIQAAADPLQKLYTRSELLGGILTLQDLNEPVMSPIARAERAQWSRSGDPLAPVPEVWRESMRKALKSLTIIPPTTASVTSPTNPEHIGINRARIIHVPSLKIKQATNVPLALQADGSVDILNHPDDPGVVEEIKSWSSKQEFPSKGSMTPAIVHLHPLPASTEPLPIQSERSHKIDLPRTDYSNASVNQSSVSNIQPQEHKISPPSPESNSSSKSGAPSAGIPASLETSQISASNSPSSTREVLP